MENIEPIIKVNKTADLKKYARDYKRAKYHTDESNREKIRYQHKKTYYTKKLALEINMSFTDIEPIAKDLCQAIQSLDIIKQTHPEILIQILNKYVY